MKKFYFILILLVVQLACIYDAPIYKEKAKINLSTTFIPSTTAYELVEVQAEKNLRLRTEPEELGGTEILLMPNGSQFLVKECVVVENTVWAYGDYINSSGKPVSGYTAARYLSGGCP